MTSYSSRHADPMTRLRELWMLARRHCRRNEAFADVFLSRMRRMEALIEEARGCPLRQARMLDIGCGQMMSQALYFSAHNHVDAIDADIIPRPWHVGDYVRMWRTNGSLRVAKTVGRRLLGVDRRFRRQLQRRLQARPTAPSRIQQMDAAHLAINDEQYDVVYSFSVFEHLADPAAALREALRVLRPGGVVCISLHLYTSHSGSHDPRALSAGRPRPESDRSGPTGASGPSPKRSENEQLPHWAHLRPRYADRVRPNSFLNRWRLQDWRNLFEQITPGSRIELLTHGRERLEPILRTLQAQGELAEYTDEELLTVDVVAVWRKDGTENLDASQLVEAIQEVGYAATRA